MKHWKKLIALLLTAALCLGTLALPASAAETPFTDVPGNVWYTDAVKYAYENGLFSGEGNGKFNPNGSMTRGMFVQVLANKADNYSKADWAGKSSFSDVNKNTWYAAPVEWASKAGLVAGKGNGRFDPNGKVTRQEMAVFLYRYAKAAGNDTSFTSSALNGFSDASAVSSWAKEAMQWAVTHKIVNGSDGKLNPGGNALRCEVAQVMKSAGPVLVKNEVEITDTPDPAPNPEPDPEPTPDPTPSDQMGLPEKYMLPGFKPDITLKNGIAWKETLTSDEYRSNTSNMNRTVERFSDDGFERVGSLSHAFAVPEYRAYFVMWSYSNPVTNEKMYYGSVNDARDYSAIGSREYCFCIKLDSPPTLEDIKSLLPD